MILSGMFAPHIVTSGGGGIDPDFASVSALLHFNGANNGNVWTDVIGNTWGRNHTNVVTSTAQFKFGTASMYGGGGGGTGGSISTPDNAKFELGSGNATIECWVRQVGNSGTQTVFVKRDPGGGNFASYGLFLVAGKPRLALSVTGAAYGLDTTAASAISTGTWVHLAYVRNGDNHQVYVDGVSVISGTLAGSLANNTGALQISETFGTPLDFNGYFDEFRFTKGVARYTSAFTPPSAAFPDS